MTARLVNHKTRRLLSEVTVKHFGPRAASVKWRDSVRQVRDRVRKNIKYFPISPAGQLWERIAEQEAR